MGKKRDPGGATTARPRKKSRISGEPKSKVTRRDVAERLKTRGTIKASLSGRIGLPEPYRSTFRQVLHDIIRSVSEIAVRGSFIFNEVLLAYLRNGVDLPVIDQTFVRRCFLEGLDNRNHDEQVLRAVVENEFYDYPPIQRQAYDGQAVTIAAKKYLTNFKTTLYTAFKQRQKVFIAYWLKSKRKDIKEISPFRVQCDVNGWKTKAEIVDDDVIVFIRHQRATLWGDEEGQLTEDYIKGHTSRVLQYLFHILEYYRDNRRCDASCPNLYMETPRV